MLNWEKSGRIGMENQTCQYFRKNKKVPVLIFLVFLFVFFRFPQEESITSASQNTSASSATQKSRLTQELFTRGEVLYQKQCSVCHGDHGHADGKAAYLLYPKPRDFSHDKFRLVSTTNMQATDEDLFTTITRGMPGSAMPPWVHLNARDRWALVYYVRYLSELKTYEDSGEINEEMKARGIPWQVKEKIINKKFNDENLIKVYPEPPVTSESLKRGQEVFIASCAGCHGPQGRGDGQQE